MTQDSMIMCVHLSRDGYQFPMHLSSQSRKDQHTNIPDEFKDAYSIFWMILLQLVTNIAVY